MDQISWLQLAVSLVTICGFLWVVYKSFRAWSAEKHAGHEKRFEDHAKLIKEIQEEIRDTRAEMLREYVRSATLEHMETKLTHAIESVHKKLGGISQALNQAIGELKASRETEIQSLATQIKDVLKERSKPSD